MFTKEDVEMILRKINNQTTFRDAKEIIADYAEKHDLDLSPEDEKEEEDFNDFIEEDLDDAYSSKLFLDSDDEYDDF